MWLNNVVFLINFDKILKDIYFINSLFTALPILGWASLKIDLFWTFFATEKHAESEKF